MSSGSEFALRVALCDLIQRLKRCEHKCLYLEQCRNQFAKEIMRLRVENEYLSSREMRSESVNYALSHLNVEHNVEHNVDRNADHSGDVHIDNGNHMVNHMVSAVSAIDGLTHAHNEQNRSFNNEYSDESWEEITVRLIRELRRDVAMTASHGYHELVSDGSIVCPPIDEDCRNNDFNASPNDGSDNKFDSKTSNFMIASNNRAQYINQNKAMNDCESSYTDVNIELTECSNQVKENIINENENKYKIIDSKDAVSPKLVESSQIDSAEGLNAFSSAIYYMRKDLDEVLHALTLQNEKLNRLKAKQLRNFFQRQINYDQAVHNIATLSPIADQKSN